MIGPLTNRIELHHLIPNAPRRWLDFGQPFDRRGVCLTAREFWRAEAEQIMGRAVDLECGENDEICCIPWRKNDTMADTVFGSVGPFADDSAQDRQALNVGSGHAA